MIFDKEKGWKTFWVVWTVVYNLLKFFKWLNENDFAFYLAQTKNKEKNEKTKRWESTYILGLITVKWFLLFYFW